MNHVDEEFDGLPDDFDIDWSITKIDAVLKSLPLSIQSYHLIMRLENQKKVKDGRMYICIYFVEPCNCMYTSLHVIKNI
jgi:septin family protein